MWSCLFSICIEFKQWCTIECIILSYFNKLGKLMLTSGFCQITAKDKLRHPVEGVNSLNSLCQNGLTQSDFQCKEFTFHIPLTLTTLHHRLCRKTSLWVDLNTFWQRPHLPVLQRKQKPRCHLSWRCTGGEEGRRPTPGWPFISGPAGRWSAPWGLQSNSASSTYRWGYTL